MEVSAPDLFARAQTNYLQFTIKPVKCGKPFNPQLLLHVLEGQHLGPARVITAHVGNTTLSTRPLADGAVAWNEQLAFPASAQTSDQHLRLELHNDISSGPPQAYAFLPLAALQRDSPQVLA